jgi:hypothetical protein
MEPKVTLLYAQKYATGPYPEPDESIPRRHAVFSWNEKG